MAYRFFMSYAHADNDRRDLHLVEKFFEGLRGEIETGVDDEGVETGYFDRFDLDVGEAWPEEMAQAARTCRVFVPPRGIEQQVTVPLSRHEEMGSTSDDGCAVESRRPRKRRQLSDSEIEGCCEAGTRIPEPRAR